MSELFSDICGGIYRTLTLRLVLFAVINARMYQCIIHAHTTILHRFILHIEANIM